MNTREPPDESAMAHLRRRLSEAAPVAALIGAILALLAIAAASFS